MKFGRMDLWRVKLGRMQLRRVKRRLFRIERWQLRNLSDCIQPLIDHVIWVAHGHKRRALVAALYALVMEICRGYLMMHWMMVNRRVRRYFAGGCSH